MAVGWTKFSRRVLKSYGFEMTADFQTWLDAFIRHNISLAPSLRLRAVPGNSEGEQAREPICASEQDHVCVGTCRPAMGVLRGGQSTFIRIPARGGLETRHRVNFDLQGQRDHKQVRGQTGAAAQPAPHAHHRHAGTRSYPRAEETNLSLAHAG